MNHKRINKLLKKIANLNDSISEDDDFSKIERDHMLSYIKELYDEAKDHDEEIEELDLAGEMSEEVEEELVIIEEEEVEPVEEIEEVVEEEEALEETILEEVPEEVEEVVTDAVDPELEALFSASEANELSDKLASLPIKDLTKAMGINERVFTVEQLFGGEQDEFNNMMSALNGLSSFGEAKHVLMHSVAKKYDWSDKAKIKKAEHFIRLVQRRYK